MICGSMYFSKEMLETKENLEKLGHEVLVADDVHDCVKNPELSVNLEHCTKNNVDKECFDKVAMADGILVLNYPRRNVDGYVGGATLMEIGLARHLNKKIFLLHDLPNEEELRYALEIKLARPVIINGNLEKVK